MEINNFREAFERGDDPLADMTDASDINSVAGVLKLYLRELREPVFSIQYFDQLMELASKQGQAIFVLSEDRVTCRAGVNISFVAGTYPLPQIYTAKDKLRTSNNNKCSIGMKYLHFKHS